MINEDTIDFHGTEVNLAKEYIQARELMGQKSTDLELLIDKVAFLYLNTTDKWEQPYLRLIYEIEDRIELTSRL